MKDIDGWIYFDGPEPDHIRPLLDALRDLSPATPEDKERLSRRFFERLDGELSQRSDPPAATGSQLAETPDERGAGNDGATARSPAFDDRLAALPADPPAPLVPVDAGKPHTAEGRPPEALTITTLALELPAEFREQLRALPFMPRAPGPDFKLTMKVPVMDRRKGETAPLGDDSIANAVAALPFAGYAVGRGMVPFPQLSLEAYASLQAELSVWPEWSADILPRYRVMNEGAREALDEHWQMQLAASPEMRAQFEKAVGEYTAWLRKHSAG